MIISIHALREEGDAGLREVGVKTEISIHALREEGDRATACGRRPTCYFYPRPPRGGRPVSGRLISRAIHHFYPRPPRGGRPSGPGGPFRNSRFLSTPSARRATSGVGTYRPSSFNFYPRPPRGGRRPVFCGVVDAFLFLSTPSARRATADAVPCRYASTYFYPRPPRGGRPRRA